MTPDEARERLDLPNLPGGDQLIGNGSTVTLEQVGIQWQQAQQQQEEPKDEESEDEDKPDEAESDKPKDEDKPEEEPEKDEPEKALGRVPARKPRKRKEVHRDNVPTT